MDVSAALTWHRWNPIIHKSDYDFLFDQAKRDYGDDIQLYIDVYLLYTTFYYCDIPDQEFVAKNLNDEEIWKRLGFYS